MSIEDFFDHKCRIYHLKDEEISVGYGVKSSPGKAYENEPAGMFPCHFYVKSDGNSLAQYDPYTAVEGTIKLSLPAGTDIRMNDKVCWEETGLDYRAGLPRDIRGHHIAVTLYRWDDARGMI